METCHDHSGCIKDISNLKCDNHKQWEEISRVKMKVDNMVSKLNVILGGIVVSLVLLALNLAIKIV